MTEKHYAHLAPNYAAERTGKRLTCPPRLLNLEPTTRYASAAKSAFTSKACRTQRQARQSNLTPGVPDLQKGQPLFSNAITSYRYLTIRLTDRRILVLPNGTARAGEHAGSASGLKGGTAMALRADAIPAAEEI